MEKIEGVGSSVLAIIIIIIFTAKFFCKNSKRREMMKGMSWWRVLFIKREKLNINLMLLCIEKETERGVKISVFNIKCN